MKRTLGALYLLLAALVWGMAFVAQSAAADSVGAFAFNAARSVIAAVFLAAVAAAKDFAAKRRGASQPTAAEERARTWRGGIICGALLFFAVNLQQLGIELYPEEAAASGRSGFLTATYVVMVAAVSMFLEKRMRISVALATAGCMAGMYMLCLSGGVSGIYIGDALVLLCAVVFAAYIFVIDGFSGCDSVRMSCVQFLVCGALSLAAALVFEKQDMRALIDAYVPILYAGVFSSGIGYTLQMAGQKHVEPAVASIIMSLESVFAALAGWAILDERLRGRELFGCALVFLSVVAAQIPGLLKSRDAAEYKKAQK